MKEVCLSVWVVVLLAVGGLAVSDPNLNEATLEEREPTESPPPFASSARPVDCADILMAGATVSGVYEIYPFTCTCGESVQVWCDMDTDGGGWTVFLNRQNQTRQLQFNRTWEEYKKGFGSPYQEYWLGNELLHKMTYSREYAVRLDMTLASGGSDYATFEDFKVNSEDQRYQAMTAGNVGGSSTTNYCLRYISGRSFTTLDRDYDSYSGNCAAVQGGAWWYYNCRDFNPTSTYKTSISLSCYSGPTRDVKELQLKLRPAICDSSFKTIHLKQMNCGCQDGIPLKPSR